jgi:hypothetical protein
MKMALWLVAGVLLACIVVYALQSARVASDEDDARRAWAALLASPVPLPQRFDPSMVAGLPEPARRFFSFAIEPGTRLATVVELTMAGEISLGTKENPGYQPMKARQVLAAPHGLVWEMAAGSGAMSVAGSDGMAFDRSWTRFWLLGCVPVVRAGDDADHLRSSYGRLVAEAAFWSPAFLLPRPGVVWAEVDRDTARVTVTRGALVQSADIRVDAQGQPVSITIPRWSNANPQHAWRLQPFGGETSDFRNVAGYRVPFRVDGGNFFGTPAYFPFYRARVLDVRFH